MITINLSPIRADQSQPTVTYATPVLTVDGTDYDLSELPDGATATHPVFGPVSRVGDDYTVTLLLPHGANAPEATRFPEPIVVTEDGAVTLPPYDEEPAE